MSICVGPNVNETQKVTPITKAAITDEELAQYYYNMHHFYNEAVERLIELVGRNVSVREIEYLERNAKEYLERYERSI